MVSAETCISAIEKDKTIKDTTKKKHMTTLRAMAKDRKINDGAWESLYDNAVLYITNKWSNPSTAKGKSESLVKLWRLCPEIQHAVGDTVFNDLHHHMISHADKAEETFKKGDNQKFQKKGVLTWDQIKETEQKLMQAHRGTQEQVYFSILVHVYIPRNEPRTIRIAQDDDDANSRFSGENVLILNEGKLILRQHKTSDIYKTTEFSVPDAVISSIREMLENRETARKRRKQNDDMMTYLFFVEKSWRPYTDSGSFSHWVKRVSKRHLGTPYTANEYRHIYASAMKLNASMEEIEESARKMHHSVSKHLAYRVKAVIEKEQEKTDEDVITDLLCRLGYADFMKIVRQNKQTLTQLCSRNSN